MGRHEEAEMGRHEERYFVFLPHTGPNSTTEVIGCSPFHRHLHPSMGQPPMQRHLIISANGNKKVTRNEKVTREIHVKLQPAITH